MPIEFYRVFWDLIGPDLLQVANYCFENKILTPTMRTGVITLLYKKGDKTYLKNWRPISLLCIDYKIITKSLANRLKTVLPHIINKDQTCGVEGRQIHDNSHLIRDLLRYVNKKNLPAIILCIDQKKAFDKISWKYLYETLKTFNFKEDFINWVKLLYTDIKSHIKNNGWISTAFKLEQGVRQGCRLSALLYILVAETLAETIHKNPNKTPIKLPDNTESKIIQYADDNTLTLSNANSLKHLFATLETYEKASGSEINKEKTEGLWSGSFRKRRDKPLDLTWKNDKIKIYGTFFGNENVDDANWKLKIDKIKKILNLWKQRNLSIPGKITVINTLLTSQIWYLSAIYPMPNQHMENLQKLFENFSWKDGKHLIQKEILYKTPEEGRINLTHIKTKIQTQRVKFILRYLDENDYKWKAFTDLTLQQLYGAHNKENILIAKYFETKKAEDPFYAQVLNSWEILHKQLDFPKIKTPRDLLHENIFKNDKMKNPANLIEKEFITANVTHIRDIIKNGELVEFEQNTRIQHIPNGENKLETIYQNIPREWKIKISNADYSEELSFSANLKNKPLNKLETKHIYSTLIDKMTQKHTPFSYQKSKQFLTTKTLTGNVSGKLPETH
jgi:hypothetical protein